MERQTIHSENIKSLDYDVTESDLLAALETAMARASDAGGAGSTVVELAESLGWTVQRVRAGLYALQKQGRLESLRVYRRALDGRYQPRPAYKLRAREKDKDGK